jgi:hypothetical protein
MLGPDVNLAEDESARGLNRAFYSAEPHEYFWHRLWLLMIAGDESIDLAEFARRGLTVDGFKAGPSERPESEPHPEADKEEERRRRFVITDAAALLHHVSETLLRFYLAHEPLPACPWLEIVRERSFSRFKKRVGARFVDAAEEDGANREALARILYGTADRATLTPAPDPADWEAGLLNLERWMRFFAREFLENAHLYNSVKHGLAVQPGEASMQLDDGSVISAEGPAVAYLEEREIQGRRMWAETTHWLKVGQLLAASYFGILLMRALWEIGRARYTHELPGHIRLFTDPQLGQFLLAGGEGIIITKMSMNLLYYADAVE